MLDQSIKLHQVPDASNRLSARSAIVNGVYVHVFFGFKLQCFMRECRYVAEGKDADASI